MPYEVFLALRYLRSRRKHRLARVTTVIAVVGIAAGVGALIVATALADGFRDEMRDKILSGTAHITVMRRDGRPLSNSEVLANQLAQVEGVSGAAATTYDGAVVIGPGASAYCVLRGVDAASPQVTTVISESLLRGSVDPLFQQSGESSLPSVVLGSELAARLGVDIGDSVDVIAAPSNYTTATANRRRVKVCGVFRSGLFEYDSTWIYLSLKTVAAFTGGAPAGSVIGVQTKNIYDVKQTARRVKQLLGDEYTVIDWQEANRPLFTALALERRIGLAIIALIVFIAALNITTTLILLVMQRRHDIAILNALGATRAGVMKIFMIEGAILGLTGALLGALLGIAVTFVANHYHLISLPADVYSVSEITLHLNAYNAALAAAVAFVLSVIATLYPAYAAAKMRPAELLRTTN